MARDVGEILASINTAAVYMAGTGDQLGSFCWGFTAGIAAALEGLGISLDSVSPRTLSGDQAEVDNKCFAGAATILDSFNDTFEKMAILEETNPGIIERKKAFLESAKERYNRFIKDTVREH
jgi:hypothetical protein